MEYFCFVIIRVYQISSEGKYIFIYLSFQYPSLSKLRFFAHFITVLFFSFWLISKKFLYILDIILCLTYICYKPLFLVYGFILFHSTYVIFGYKRFEHFVEWNFNQLIYIFMTYYDCFSIKSSLVCVSLLYYNFIVLFFIVNISGIWKFF